MQQTAAGTRIINKQPAQTPRQQTPLGGGAQRDARTAAQGQQQQAQRTNVAQRTNAAQGGTSQTTNNNAQAARPNDASRYDDMIYGNGQQQPAQTNATPTNRPAPLVFKGGHTVGGVSGDIDWTKQGDGSINVGGNKFTAD